MTDTLYIKMCEKAKRYLPWKPTKGDWFIYKGRPYCIGRGIIEYEYDLDKGKGQKDIVVEDWTFYDVGPNETDIVELSITMADGYDDADHFRLSECIPLWNVDQLISIDGDDWYNFMRDCLDYYKEHFSFGEVSMESVALLIVMKQVHRKTWNGEDWVPLDK
ncbi:MAG: hypothetical protein A4E65_00796 [Syntrophorhabdus sp. PtaU1.Bin153]|nr:MAG: hypothetical protein A4E65_00796 [Syntrophorhabdus sp. PtaU1.Bin153]